MKKKILVNQGRMVTKMRVLVTKTIRDNCITKTALNTTLFPLVTKREHDSDWLSVRSAVRTESATLSLEMTALKTVMKRNRI